MNILNNFKNGLKKTSAFLSSNIKSSFTSQKINPEVINNIETVLISADVGLEVTNHLINKIKSNKDTRNINSTNIMDILSEEISKILKICEEDIIKINEDDQKIFLFVGVNGSGKTTTIGKLIKKMGKNKKILVAACDTFRAAAVDQLKQISNNISADFFQGSINQDPASVAFGACEVMKKENYDLLFIDTAGRLSNNTNLLNQLVKIKSVVSKSASNIILKTILVLDGTNGSNMLNQVEKFGNSLDINGIIITKLDGTAKGGALISVANNYQIPIHFVCLGEKVDDLFEFNATDFSKSLLEIET